MAKEVITEEQLKEYKAHIAEAIPRLKKDYDNLKKMIDLFESYVENGTVEDAEDYGKRYEDIDSNFELIEVWDC